jgi:hypothetical protein
MDSILIPIKFVPTSYARAVVIVCSFLLFFAWKSIIMRLWTRIFVIPGLGVDDVAALLASVYSS